MAFIDGQNLFHAAKDAFGYTYPNFEVSRLCGHLCAAQGWTLASVRFYTGIPEATDSPFWNHFWNAKLGAMGHRGVHVFSRPLRYRNKRVAIPGGSFHFTTVPEEKGIDVRIAIDVIRMAHRKEYDVAILFSQDQDLSEAVDEIRAISKEQDRWIKVASAFPKSPSSTNRRGINHTDWIGIDRATYDSCLDHADYRPPKAP